MDATPEQLAGRKAYALRFVEARSGVVVPTYLPAMVLFHGVRDSANLRALAADSVDTGAFCLARAGAKLLKALLKSDRCGEPVECMFDKAVEVCNEARHLRTTRLAKISGSMGDSSNIRKSRVGLVKATQEERERMIEIYTRLVYTNGIQSVMDAIGEVDQGFVEWGMERMVAAKEMSTNFERDEIKNDDHLFGTNPDGVAEGRMGVAGIVDKLEAKGITCRDFVVVSVATMLTVNVSGATIRTKDLFSLFIKAIWYNDEYDVLTIGMPIKAKQSDAADRKLEIACKEHEILGHGIVRWCMVMALVGREMLKKHNNVFVSCFFGPLQTTGKQLSRDVFGPVFKECARAFFGEANMSVSSMRSVQDTLGVEYGRELGLPKDHEAFVLLAKQQRTSLKKLFTACQALTGRGGFVATYRGFVSFVGGIRKMIEDRRVRETNKKAMGISSTVSDVGVSGAGGGSDRVPFCGGPLAPIDAEEAEAAKQLRMSEMKAKAAANKVKAARDEEETAAIRARLGLAVPADVGEGGATGGVTAARAMSDPAVTGPASDQKKEASGRGSSSSRKGMSYKKPASEAVCTGMQELARAVGEAWKRAKKRGVENEVYKKMNGRKNSATLFLAQYLVDEDGDFQPGDWYTSSKFAALKNPGSFNTKINAVGGEVEGWTWESWKSM